MVQIELFNYLLTILIMTYLKQYSGVQMIYISKDYLFDGITDVK